MSWAKYNEDNEELLLERIRNSNYTHPNAVTTEGVYTSPYEMKDLRNYRERGN